MTNYNVMIKISKEDLIDIINIKKKKNRIKWQKWCQKYVIHFINTISGRKCSSLIVLMGINDGNYVDGNLMEIMFVMK